jgi:uncharacterized protein YbgA (DUF1722 family)
MLFIAVMPVCRAITSLDSHVAAFPNKFIAKYLELLQ